MCWKGISELLLGDAVSVTLSVPLVDVRSVLLLPGVLPGSGVTFSDIVHDELLVPIV